MAMQEEGAVTLVPPEKNLLSIIFDKYPVWQKAPARLRFVPNLVQLGLAPFLTLLSKILFAVFSMWSPWLGQGISTLSTIV